jgi:hypothetical protein
VFASETQTKSPPTPFLSLWPCAIRIWDDAEVAAVSKHWFTLKCWCHPVHCRACVYHRAGQRFAWITDTMRLTSYHEAESSGSIMTTDENIALTDRSGWPFLS